VFCGWIGL